MSRRRRRITIARPLPRHDVSTRPVTAGRPPRPSFEDGGRRLVGLYAPSDDATDDLCPICVALGQWICSCGTVIFGRAHCTRCGEAREL